MDLAYHLAILDHVATLCGELAVARAQLPDALETALATRILAEGGICAVPGRSAEPR